MSLISKGAWRMALLPKGRRLLRCRLVLKRKVDKNGYAAFRPVKDLGTGNDTCLKAEKALYGLKQSPRCWGMKLHKLLIKVGFERSDTDSCLYLMTRKRTKTKDSSLKVHDRFDKEYIQIALVVYVDDLTARVDLDCSETKEMCDEFVKNMFKGFVEEDWGILDSMLGYKIDYDKERALLKLTQKSCLLELLERTGLSECRIKRTPAEAGIKPHVKWSPGPETEAGKKEIEWPKEQDYANRVGSTSWLSRGSRPETAWTTGSSRK